jgi:hypothetical protein
MAVETGYDGARMFKVEPNLWRAAASVDRRRIWSEHLPIERLVAPETQALLAEHQLQLIVAIQPQQITRVAELIEACRDHGVELALWPLLHDRAGRWASESNLVPYREHLLAVLAVIERVRFPMTLVFDLEPPIDRMRKLLRLELGLRPAGVPTALLGGGVGRFDELTRQVRQRGHTPIAVVPPMVLLDPARRRGGWQRLLETPVDGVGFERVIVMAYTSLFEGYSFGSVTRRDARSLLAHLALLARRRWGRRAALALGVVGGGALGDERPYRDLDELGDDVGLSLAAGVNDLSLFDLTGVLARAEGARPWLARFLETPPSASLPRLTPRGAAILASGALVSRLFDWARGRARSGA